jgi:hypothetical protein
MRLLPMIFLASSIGVNAAAQCPIQLRQASLDAIGKSVTIRYYNSGTHIVRAVQFVVTNENSRPYSVIGNFSARDIVRPKQERKSVFPNIHGTVFNESMELEVERVTFSDQSTWIASGDNTCKARLTEP